MVDAKSWEAAVSHLQFAQVLEGLSSDDMDEITKLEQSCLLYSRLV